MARASLTTLLPLRRTAGLTVLSLATLACGGGPSDALGSTAQAGGRTGIKQVHFDPHTHPLDEATARKVVAVMRSWTPPLPEPSPKRQAEADFMGAMRDVLERSFTNVAFRELTEQNSTATIDGTPALKVAIYRHGLSSREFAKALLAFQIASFEIGARDMLKSQGIKHPYELAGTAKANVDLVRKLMAEGDVPSEWF